MLTVHRKNTNNLKIERHCVLLLVGIENMAKMRCCNTNFRIKIGKRPLQHISATKSEAGACLAVCLKYQRFQPKRAYNLRAYKKKVVRKKMRNTRFRALFAPYLVSSFFEQSHSVKKLFWSNLVQSRCSYCEDRQ